MGKIPRIRTHHGRTTEYCTACNVDVSLFPSGSNTVCYNQTVFKALETQQTANTQCLAPRWDSLGSQRILPVGTALGRATVQPPALKRVRAQFTADCFRFWPAGSCRPRGTEIVQSFWAARFAVLMVTAAKAHSRREQKWAMNDLHSSLGILWTIWVFPLLGGQRLIYSVKYTQLRSEEELRTMIPKKNQRWLHRQALHWSPGRTTICMHTWYADTL